MEATTQTLAVLLQGGSVRLGARRYTRPFWKDRFLGAAAQAGGAQAGAALNSGGIDAGADEFQEAILALAREDESLQLSEERGPIMFKDGLFQIDVDHAHEPEQIDPGLKTLIDSILHH